MSEPIKVGDLVVVVRGCCPTFLGVIRRVEGFDAPAKMKCAVCGARADGHPRARFEGNATPSASLVAWLKRIPPLEKLQTWRQTEETTG